MNKLSKNTKGITLNIKTKEAFSNCKVCLKSKFSSRINRDLITTPIKEFGDLIYCDLRGPIKPRTNKGYRYYITFLDYKTKYLEVNLLTTRSKLIDLVRAFVKRVETQDLK